jgi:hypothetical protein
VNSIARIHDFAGNVVSRVWVEGHYPTTTGRHARKFPIRALRVSA